LFKLTENKICSGAWTSENNLLLSRISMSKNNFRSSGLVIQGVKPLIHQSELAKIKSWENEKVTDFQENIDEEKIHTFEQKFSRWQNEIGVTDQAIIDSLLEDLGNMTSENNLLLSRISKSKNNFRSSGLVIQ
jgi:hypothetical protein